MLLGGGGGKVGDQQHWGGMGLNVQSGHSKVAVQVHSFFFCDSSVIHRLFLLLPLLQPPAIYPTELCWWGKPARTLPRTLVLFSSFVSLSPLSFPPVFLLFHWVKNERCF